MSTTEIREEVDQLSTEELELEAKLRDARERRLRKQRDLMAAEAEAAAPKPEARKRKQDFTLELNPPRNFPMADRTLYPGDTIKASELQDAIGDTMAMRYMSMGWFKVLDKDFPRTQYPLDELRHDQAFLVATGCEYEPPTVSGRPSEDEAKDWAAEAAMMERIRKENAEIGVTDAQQRVLDQQRAEIARFADAQAAMRVDGEGRTPDPGVQLNTAGGPVVEDGEIVNPGTPFVEPADDDVFVDVDDDEPAGEPEPEPDPPVVETPEEQRFESAAIDNMTVAEVKEYVDTFPAERRDEILMKVFDVETAGKNRSTLISWIEEELGE